MTPTTTGRAPGWRWCSTLGMSRGERFGTCTSSTRWPLLGKEPPLHVHPIDEAILVEGGRMEVRIGDTVDQVGPEGVAFIPRGLPHAWRSVGDVDLKLRAVFPTDVLAIQYLERNPAPGTEDDPPRPPWWVDLREALAP